MNDVELLKELPEHRRAEALRRVGIVKEFESFAAHHIRDHHGTRTEALAQFSLIRKIPERTLYLWLQKFKDNGFSGLVDMRGRADGITDTISSDAFELFKSLYLTQQQLSVKQCFQSVKYINRVEKKGWLIPGLRTMYRLIDKRIPIPAQVLHREGQSAYEAKCAPYIQVNPDGIEPGAVWVGDHSQFNCWVRHGGRWIRPWLTAWQDMRSRALVGWHISASPNQTTILLAMKMGIQQYGPPDSVKIDNGKDYDSEMWTGQTKTQRRKEIRKGYLDEENLRGIYSMLDVTVSFAIPYHPQSKRIERMFDTIDCQLIKTFATYCGKDTKRKPEELCELLKQQKTIDKARDLEGFTELFARYVEAYNNTVHTGIGMDGRTPMQVFETRTSRRVVLDEILDLLLKVWSGKLTVGKNGVRLKGLYYGQTDPVILALQGREVRVSYDPADMRQVYVYDAATMKLLSIAQQNRLTGYGRAVDEATIRGAMQLKAQAQKTAKKYRDTRLTVNMDLPDLAIRSMQDGKRKVTERAVASLRPVRTPLDGQADIHKAANAKLAARPKPKEQKLDFDFSLLKPEKPEMDLKLFDDDGLVVHKKRRVSSA